MMELALALAMATPLVAAALFRGHGGADSPHAPSRRAPSSDDLQHTARGGWSALDNTAAGSRQTWPKQAGVVLPWRGRSHITDGS